MSTHKTVSALIAEAQRQLFGWIPYEEYVRVFPSETRHKVRGRLRRGQWQMGVHAIRGGHYELWIHLRNVQAWLEGRQPEVAGMPAQMQQDSAPMPEAQEPEEVETPVETPQTEESPSEEGLEELTFAVKTEVSEDAQPPALDPELDF